MKDKTPFSIKLIYWLTNIASALFILVILGVIVFKILFHLNVLGGEFFLHMNLPVKVGFNEVGETVVDGETFEVLIPEATGKMAIQNTPRSLVNFVSWTLIFVVGLAAYILWLFRKFVKNVRNGVIFTIDNIKSLKHLSYGLFGFWVLQMVYERMLYHYIVKRIEFENVKISDEFNDHGTVLLVALLIWVLYHIFITGLKMKEDLELTV